MPVPPLRMILMMRGRGRGGGGYCFQNHFFIIVFYDGPESKMANGQNLKYA